MTYGYASSAPTLTLNLTPEQRAAGRDVARLLGLAQTRGATAGEGSLSKLITAIAQHAADHNPRNTASRLVWTTRVIPATRWREHTMVMIEDKLIPQLTAVAKYAGHLRHTGPAERIGDGSANALIASIAQHAHVYGAEFTARKLKWLVN